MAHQSRRQRTKIVHTKIKCLTCGKEVIKRVERQRFCCPKHRNAWHNQQKKLADDPK